VRIDSSFYGKDVAYFLAEFLEELKKPDGGNQVEHLMSKLRYSWKDKYEHDENNRPFPEYQIVYQPAMHMTPDGGKLTDRNEEGCLIISKYPVVSSQISFLPRDIGNPSDDHQRILLIVQVQVPFSQSNNEESIIVTVVTSHWSLLSTSRDIATERVFHVLNTNEKVVQSPVHILTGDLNAEPHENAILFLRQSTENRPDGFLDSWEYVARMKKFPSLSSEEREVIGYTFPACAPVKRIDFIFVRNFTVSDSTNRAQYAEIVDSFVTGKHPTSATKHLVNSRDGIGMNDLDSPLWASDHFAVVTDLLLHSHPSL